MEKITIAQKDGNVKELSASSIEDPVKFSWGYSVVLQQPVTLDGATLPLDASIDFNGGTVCQMEDGVNIQGSVKLFVNNSDTVSLRILTAECNSPTLQTILDDSQNISQFRGISDLFEYTVDIHLDNVNPSASKFIVQLSCLGFQLVDVQLDEQHPTQSFSVSFDIVIVTGEIGIDSIKKRIYASISLKHPFGEKKYEFDLYNWGNIKVQTLQLKEDTTIGDNSVLASMNTLQYGNLSGSITVKNRGRYLAKFKVSFKLNGKYIKRESESFGYLVNKTINIPADATDITLEVLAGLYLLGTWSSIFTDHFDTPVNKTYKLTGDVFNPDCIEIE